MIETGLPEARSRAKNQRSLAERSVSALVAGTAVGAVVGAGLVLLDNYSNQGTLHRSDDPRFTQPPQSTDSDCPKFEGRSPFTVPGDTQTTPIQGKLLNFIEENSDTCETEGTIKGTIKGRNVLFFVKPSFPTSLFFTKMFDRLNIVLSDEFPSIHSKIVAPEQTIVQAETGQLLAATLQIKPTDGRPFRSFSFDRFKQLVISHRENPDILPMILVALCIVPHLHTRDMGVCDGALCVTDLDNTDFSLSTFYSTALRSLTLLIDHKIPILNDHSITTAIKILKRVRDEIPHLDFSPFDCINIDVLEENSAPIIDSMKRDNINTKHKIDPEKSFADLLHKLKTQTTPQLLKNSLALRIDAGLIALEETKETPLKNLKSRDLTMRKQLDVVKSTLRMRMIEHSSDQHNRSIEEIRGHADAATHADQLSNEFWELAENTMKSDPKKMSEDDGSNLEKSIIELRKARGEAGRRLSGYSEDTTQTHWPYALSKAIRLFSENTYAKNPDNDQKLEL